MNIKNYPISILIIFLILITVACNRKKKDNILTQTSTVSNNVTPTPEQRSPFQSLDEYVYVTEWGSEGIEHYGKLNEPTNIAIDSRGNVYVIEFNTDRIQKFDNNGKFMRNWGHHGARNGQFDNIDGITINSEDFIYISDFSNDRIQKFNTNGRFITSVGAFDFEDERWLSHPRGIAIDPEGNILITGDHHYIHKFTSEGKYLTRWDYGSFRPYYNGAWGYILPDIEIDKSGYIYLVCAINRGCYDQPEYKSLIQKFDKSFNLITEWGYKGERDKQFKSIIEFTGAPDFMIDSAGYLYVIAYSAYARINDKNIEELSKKIIDRKKLNFIKSLKNRTFSGFELNGELRRLSFSKQEMVMVFTYADSINYSIQIFDSSGKFISDWKPVDGKGKKVRATDIRMDAERNIFLVESVNNRILKFSPRG